MFHTQGTVQPHHGRIYVHLADVDGHEVYPHGVVVAPANITTEQGALEAIDQAYWQAVRANPKEWTYDDVIHHLEALGWEHICCAYWVEHEAGVDPEDDGTSGQDRESYSDTQDRESYEVDPELEE